MTDRSVNEYNMLTERQKRNEEIRESSINKILDTALELFSSHGYEYTSMSLIAKEAGISKGLIYNYFDSKEQLLFALIENLHKEDNKYREVFDNENPREVLESLFRIFFKEIKENSRIWKMITALSLQLEKFDFIHDMALKKLHGYYYLIEQQLNKIGYPNPSEETKLIAALFDGIGLHYLIIKEDYPLSEIENYLIKKYCRYNEES